MGNVRWLPQVLLSAGLDVDEVSGADSRGLSEMYEVGTMWHHVAGGSTGEIPSLPVLVNGRSDLRGPLCNLALGRSGRFYYVAAYRANHAGTGVWKNYSGSKHFVGIEAENDGRQPWPDAQLEAYHRGTAAIQKHIGRSSAYVPGHKEYATPLGRKPDPHTLDMETVRRNVQILMDGGDVAIGGPIMLLGLKQGDTGDRVEVLQRMVETLDRKLWEMQGKNDRKWGSGLSKALGGILHNDVNQSVTVMSPWATELLMNIYAVRLAERAARKITHDDRYLRKGQTYTRSQVDSRDAAIKERVSALENAEPTLPPTTDGDHTHTEFYTKDQADARFVNEDSATVEIAVTDSD